MSFAAQMELVTKQLIALAKKSGKSVAEAEQKLQAAREGLDLARVEWHTFSLNRVESSLGDVFKNLREAREISLRPGPSKGTSYQDEGEIPSHRLAVLGGGRR
jgi:predicted ATPase